MWLDEDTLSQIIDIHLTVHMEKHQNYTPNAVTNKTTETLQFWKTTQTFAKNRPQILMVHPK